MEHSSSVPESFIGTDRLVETSPSELVEEHGSPALGMWIGMSLEDTFKEISRKLRNNEVCPPSSIWRTFRHALLPLIDNHGVDVVCDETTNTNGSEMLKKIVRMTVSHEDKVLYVTLRLNRDLKITDGEKVLWYRRYTYDNG